MRVVAALDGQLLRKYVSVARTSESDWRASLVPAAAVIPAPIV